MSDPGNHNHLVERFVTKGECFAAHLQLTKDMAALTESVTGGGGLQEKMDKVTLLLLGDGTDESPGLANEFHYFIKRMKEEDQQRQRRAGYMMAAVSGAVLLADRVVTWFSNWHH